MSLNLARFLSDPRLYHLLLYCTSMHVYVCLINVNVNK